MQGMLNQYYSSDRYSQHFIQGGCFGGKRKAVKYLFNNYYIFLKQYYKKHRSIRITEEMLLDLLIFKINNSVLVPNNPNKCKYLNRSETWFYYISVLSGHPIDCIRNLKLSYLNEY